MEQVFGGLDKALQEKILGTKLTIYICEGEEPEIKKWFETINIAGVPLNEQELLNAIYSGPFVTRAKEVFSNAQNPQQQKWSAYIKGDPKRQEVLRTALSWVAKVAPATALSALWKLTLLSTSVSTNSTRWMPTT